MERWLDTETARLERRARVVGRYALFQPRYFTHEQTLEAARVRLREAVRVCERVADSVFVHVVRLTQNRRPCVVVDVSVPLESAESLRDIMWTWGLGFFGIYDVSTSGVFQVRNADMRAAERVGYAYIVIAIPENLPERLDPMIQSGLATCARALMDDGGEMADKRRLCPFLNAAHEVLGGNRAWVSAMTFL